LGENKDIDRHAEAAQNTPQPDRLLDRVANKRLDNQDIDIGAHAILLASSGAKKHDPRPCRRRFGETSADFDDQRVI
jgi:hypothetical protein